MFFTLYFFNEFCDCSCFSYLYNSFGSQVNLSRTHTDLGNIGLSKTASPYWLALKKKNDNGKLLCVVPPGIYLFII